MFKTIQLTDHWSKYLHNRVDGITAKGEVLDPLGIKHAIEDIEIDEDASGNLRAVAGHYHLGGIQCCFYAVPLLTMVCRRGKIVDQGYLKNLDLYWFKVAVYELKQYRVHDRPMSRWELTDQHRLYWASGNKHLAKNIEMYGVLGDALINEGYYSSVEQGLWILDFKGSIGLNEDGKEEVQEPKKYRVHKVLIRTKKQHREELMDEQIGVIPHKEIKDSGGFILEVYPIPEGEGYGAKTQKELLYVEYPTQNIPVPRWELIHDAGIASL